MDVAVIVILAAAHYGALALLLRQVARILAKLVEIESQVGKAGGDAREAASVARSSSAAVAELRAEVVPRLEQLEVHPRIIGELRRLK